MSEKHSIIQPRTPSGTTELLPRQQIAFQRFMDTIRKGYERFGFLPIETPVFETTQILLTKEGGETEKQVFFVQSTGSLKQGDAPDMALRFDLTVPLARYVAEHEHELNFPFRRYQMQRCYRGERPQRGRGREFYQCDIDVIGKDELSIGYDAELPAIIFGIFTQLGVKNFQIRVNNRKLLKGILLSFGLETAEQQKAALHEIDRLDKMAVDEVKTRLISDETGLDEARATALLAILTMGGSNEEKLARLAPLASNEVFSTGLGDLKTVYEGARSLGVTEEAIAVSLTTVRGLDYYTGTVYETFLTDDLSLGSICSGGRYENLAGYYTKSKLPGVGVSIGASRLFEVLLEKGFIKAEETALADVLIIQVDTSLMPDYFKLAAELRADGLKVEVYVDPHKMGKQLKYADRAGVPFALLMGSDEKARGTVTLKNLRKAEQEEIPLAKVATRLLGLRAT
jgi:histidyl-tRNA synthetase